MSQDDQFELVAFNWDETILSHEGIEPRQLNRLRQIYTEYNLICKNNPHISQIYDDSPQYADVLSFLLSLIYGILATPFSQGGMNLEGGALEAKRLKYIEFAMMLVKQNFPDVPEEFFQISGIFIRFFVTMQVV